mmetsp:Transcript_638/g.1021  ORF Transcript_638/g.1021 Transcript_638/m.1021 type:complete len:81 (-) Transcript_638:153-395(-)
MEEEFRKDSEERLELDGVTAVEDEGTIAEGHHNQCKLENKCKALEDKNAVLSRQLEEVAKMATTASNKADEAKKLASKSK